MSGTTQSPMGGSHIRKYFSQEVTALLATYRQFEALAAHSAEDGRYVEFLIRSCLKKFLPSNLEVSSGFILRPAVKTGTIGRERGEEEDRTSTQLDILVFDAAHYPPFQRYDNAVIVPPEGVVGIISVKKTLWPKDIIPECGHLSKAAEYCRTLNIENTPRRGPFLALVGMAYPEKLSQSNMPQLIFKKISSAYTGNPELFFDEVVGCVSVLSQGSAFKSRPANTPDSARFAWHPHEEDHKRHLPLQFLLTGILSVYYDETRSSHLRPGFTAFSSEDSRGVKTLGKVSVKGSRWRPRKQ